MKTQILFWVFFLKSLILLAQPSAPTASISNLQQDADRYIQRGHFDSATSSLEKIILVAANARNKRAEAAALQQLADMIK